MLKMLSLSLLFLTLLSLLAPNTASAELPCDSNILNACYNSCKELFDVAMLRTACYSGCLIGCITSGTD